MSTTQPAPQSAPLHNRPKRADARRNYDKVIAAGRAAFTEGGTATSLEEIARRAGVGIGTLYRNFPNRQALLEAIYVDEVEALCRTADELSELEPWDAFAAWVRRFVGYMQTKQALAAELLDYVDRDSPLFSTCRGAMFSAGGPLLERAQASGAARPDVDIDEVIQLVGGIAKMQRDDPKQVDRILAIALDGLRFAAASD